MALPSYEEFIGPLLHFLGKRSQPVRARDAYEAVADEVGLTEEDREEMLPSKTQLVYKNRISWAQDALRRGRYATSPQRGHWQITDEGRKLLKKYPDGLPQEENYRISRIARDVPLKEIEGGKVTTAKADTEPESITPQEQIENGLAEIRNSVASELLEIVKRSTPLSFENLVLEVLHAMGYGTSRTDLKRVGGPGDGGIDGIISQDKLGLDKIYVQAKRWERQVGTPEIQGFMGALQLQGATKGVLITSGSVSGPATDSAKQAKGTVVVIDGQRLANLMIDHGVGVSNKVLKVPAVDSDYFEDE